MFSTEAEKVLRKGGEETIQAFIKERLSGNPIKQRTGELASRKSFLIGTQNDGAGRTLTLSIRGKQVNLLEYGMEPLRPKNSKYLAIPTDAARDSRGVPRWEGPLTYPFATTDRLVKTEEGYLVFGPDDELYYVYRKEVNIPAQLGWRDFVTSKRVKNIFNRYVSAFRKDFLARIGLRNA